MASSSDFVFTLKPGVVPSGRIYATMATLEAAASLVPQFKCVVLDDSVAPIVIPPKGGGQSWNLGDYILYGKVGTLAIATLQDGCTFASAPGEVANLFIYCENSSQATPHFTITASLGVFKMLNAYMITNGAGPMIRATTPSGYIFMDNASLAHGTSATPGLKLTNTAYLVFYLGNDSSVVDNMINGDVGSTVQAIYQSGRPVFDMPQPSMLGTYADPLDGVSEPRMFGGTFTGAGAGVPKTEFMIPNGRAFLDATTGTEYPQPNGRSVNTHAIVAQIPANTMTTNLLLVGRDDGFDMGSLSTLTIPAGYVGFLTTPVYGPFVTHGHGHSYGIRVTDAVGGTGSAIILATLV